MTQRTGLIVVILSLLVAGGATAASPPTTCQVADRVPGDCYEKLELRLVTGLPTAISRTGNDLTITARNGKKVTFVSNPDGEGYEAVHHYRAIGVIINGAFVVVHDGRWEGRDIHLVSLVDGTRHRVNGIPTESPDGQRLTIHSLDLEAQYDRNFLSVYRISGTSLVQEALLDGDGDLDNPWGPGNVKWPAIDRITFERVTLNVDDMSYQSEPWQLNLVDGDWQATPIGKAADDKESSITFMPPRMFGNLPSEIAEALESQNCTVPQTYQNGSPDNVITGNFAKNDQQDWAVLCSKNGVSMIQVFWGGDTQCPSEIGGSHNDHWLQEIGSGHVGFSRLISPISGDDIMQRIGLPGIEAMPSISHQGIDDAFMGKASTVHYCLDGKWIELSGAD